ncbi:hypothetical protein [Coleofasciculus sp. E1-EBD-02]|uniref:hypothetical protein n=1 Tax=Coleofasciculus sp. E1-EBD-02 TaxID=3068481 RepID=UPI0032F40A73
MLHLHGLSRAEFKQQGMKWRDFMPPELGGEPSTCREQGFGHQTPLVGISLRLRRGGCQSGKPKRERSLG